MKQLLNLLVAVIFLSTPLTSFAQADIPFLGRPEALLAEAKLSSKDFLEVLLRLKDNVRELRDQPTFDEFFALLDEFEVLAQGYNLDLIYPGAVEEVGRSMILHGNRWLKISSDEPEKILAYQKWADLTVALRVQGQFVEEISKIKEEALFRKAFSNLLILEAWARTYFSDDLYLVPTYQNTISDLSFRALMNIDIAKKDEWSFWIAGVNTQNSAQDYVSFLNEKILLEELKHSEVQSWLELSVSLGEQLKTIDRLSSSVKYNYGVFVSDLMAKAIFNEFAIDDNLFARQVKLLDISSLRSLAFRWVNPEKAFSDHYAVKLVNLSQILHNEVRNQRLGSSALEIERFVSKYLSPVMATQLGIEGTYHLSGQNGSKWIFTLVRETEDRLIAALCRDSGVACFSFFNIQYDLKSNMFLASEGLPNDGSSQNIPALISFVNDKVKIELPLAYRVGSVFTGVKVQSFENIMAQTDMDAVAVEGRYRGTIELEGGVKPFELFITTFGEYSIGRLESLDGNLRIELSKANDGRIGFIYMTSGRNQKGTWFHLRLKQKGHDDLEGVAISGGMGVLGKASFTRYYGE